MLLDCSVIIRDQLSWSEDAMCSHEVLGLHYHCGVYINVTLGYISRNWASSPCDQKPHESNRWIGEGWN